MQSFASDLSVHREFFCYSTDTSTTFVFSLKFTSTRVELMGAMRFGRNSEPFEQKLNVTQFLPDWIM